MGSTQALQRQLLAKPQLYATLEVKCLSAC